ncbi:MAG: hypothetical protein AAGD38_15175 [Acidobacteriota bacterium]
MSRVTVIGSLTTGPSAETLARVPEATHLLAIEADRLGDLEPATIRQFFAGRLLYRLRSQIEGGAGDNDPRARERRLLWAAERYDLVALEAARDLRPRVLAAIPRERRVIMWCGTVTEEVPLQARAEQALAESAALHVVTPQVTTPVQALEVISFLRRFGRRHVAAWAEGEAGEWTRVVAPHLGARVVWGVAVADPETREPVATREPMLQRLILDYGLPELPTVERLHGLVGNGAESSLLPRIHNAAYRALGVPALYVPFPIAGFGGFWRHLVNGSALEHAAMPLAALTVYAPFKEAGLAVAGSAHRLAQRGDAANILVRDRMGTWRAGATTPGAVVAALDQLHIDVEGLSTVVIGCGGSGRTLAAELQSRGAVVTLANRTVDRGQRAARRQRLPFMALDELDIETFRLVVTAIPRTDAPVIEAGRLTDDTTVVDLVHGGSTPTEWVRMARSRELQVIDGETVLLLEACAQIRAMTGYDLTVEQLREQLDGMAA